jgi:hypothetical protein
LHPSAQSTKFWSHTRVAVLSAAPNRAREAFHF